MHSDVVTRWAEVLVNYSLALRPGDLFVLEASPAAEPLALEVYRLALRAGANVELLGGFERANEIFFAEASDAQLAFVSPVRRLLVERADAHLRIHAPANVKALAGVDAGRLAARNAAGRDLQRTFLERAARGELRWTYTVFPTQALAQEAGMSLTAYERFLTAAGLLDRPDPVAAWQDLDQRLQRLADFLSGVEELHFTAPGTDLTVNVGGRTWIRCAGKENFPDGEIFTAPREDSAEGTITFTFPGFYMGREVEGVRLTFRGGRVVDAAAERGQDVLEALLDTDEGARRIGEIALGVNDGITVFTRNTLFDEKIGGTMHLALGAAYPESGGSNASAIHWDLVCDLRHGGEVRADGRPILRDGRLLIEG